MGKLSAAQKEKRDFRKSKAWEKFRHLVYVAQSGIDIITHKKLYSGCNCHHCDLREKNYKKIDDISRFCMLNKKTHEFIHWIFPYYDKDSAVIDRLITVLENMKRCSND